MQISQYETGSTQKKDFGYSTDFQWKEALQDTYVPKYTQLNVVNVTLFFWSCKL